MTKKTRSTCTPDLAVELCELWWQSACAYGADRDRTDDLLVANQMLSQLSYRPGPPQSTVGGPPGRLTD
jgi:hypothetical protein